MGKTHNGNDDKNVDDELDKDGDDCHHSFVMPLVMSCQGIMMVCLRVLRLSAFVETQTHQFYF